MVRLPPFAWLGLAMLSLSVPPASAQLSTGDVHVYVTLPDERSPQEQVKVELIAAGNQVAETFTNDHGQAQFLGIAIGTYHVRVSGGGIQDTESEAFEVDARKATQTVFVRVMPSSENQGANRSSADPTVSAENLRIPGKATREFDKASELMSKQQWQKAAERLQKALALYPNYPQAYNNLGVVYARLGDSDKEREALEKALSANDHFAPALVNLGQMEMQQHQFAAAEHDFERAASVGPADVRTLVLLAQAELLNTQFQEVIETAHKVHTMSHASFARVHYVAARACERLHRFPEAVSELKLFLQEEPSGPFTAAATQELAALENTLR
jgi:tetratricopeptide (TPR) repeat protein